jgi:hypothetical protein
MRSHVSFPLRRKKVLSELLDSVHAMMFLTSKPPVPGRSLKLIKRDEKVPSTMVVLIAESGIDADWSPSPVD